MPADPPVSVGVGSLLALAAGEEGPAEDRYRVAGGDGAAGARFHAAE